MVNDLDEVVGQLSRSEVHRLGLTHRAVHVLVFNQRGDVFLQKRSQLKDRQPSLWDSSSSGHVDTGEDYDACALRELSEELGFRPATPPGRLFKLTPGPETDHEHVWVYHCRGEGPFVLQADEISEGKWLAPAGVDAWLVEHPGDFTTGFATIWRRWQRDEQPA